MTDLHSFALVRSLRRVWGSVLGLGLMTLAPITALAQNTPVFDGGGLKQGAQDFGSGIKGIATGNITIRSVLQNVLLYALNITTLLAVVAVIIAAFYLLLGFGSDNSRDKAKKIIIYTLVALLIILFARVIVAIVTITLASQVAK